MKIISVAEFYEDKHMPLPDMISREIGHFNVFDVAVYPAAINPAHGERLC